MVPPETLTECTPLSSALSGLITTVKVGYTLVNTYAYVASAAYSDVASNVCTASSAARAAGTNAEPKSPASKPAVVTAVTSLFLMN